MGFLPKLLGSYWGDVSVEFDEGKERGKCGRLDARAWDIAIR